VHFILFEDAFQSTRTQLDVAFNATYLSAGNFPYHKRWDTLNYPSMLQILIRYKKAFDSLNPNQLHALLTPGFQKAARGVDVFCHQMGRMVRVFGVVLVILCDLPGRCEMAELNIGTLAEKCCHTCKISNNEHLFSFDEEYVD